MRLNAAQQQELQESSRLQQESLLLHERGLLEDEAADKLDTLGILCTGFEQCCLVYVVLLLSYTPRLMLYGLYYEMFVCCNYLVGIETLLLIRRFELPLYSLQYPNIPLSHSTLTMNIPSSLSFLQASRGPDHMARRTNRSPGDREVAFDGPGRRASTASGSTE